MSLLAAGPCPPLGNGHPYPVPFPFPYPARLISSLLALPSQRQERGHWPRSQEGSWWRSATPGRHLRSGIGCSTSSGGGVSLSLTPVGITIIGVHALLAGAV